MENGKFVPPQRTANPVTRAAFRRQVWTQIYLPLAVGIGLIAGIAALLYLGDRATISAWADASLLLLLLPVLVVSLLPIVVLAVLTYGVIYLSGLIPGPAHQAQRAVARIQRAVHRGSRVAVRPILVARSSQAVLQAAGQRLLSVFRKEETHLS